MSSTNSDLSSIVSSFDRPENFENLEKNYLDFLNKYGAKALYTAITSEKYYHEPVLQDLTNDGEPEIIVRPFSTFIFGCKDGLFVKLLQLYPDAGLNSPDVQSIKDANSNGLPEITFLTTIYSRGGRGYQVYEWNGDRFANLLVPSYEDYPDSEEIFVSVSGKIHYEDVDHDLIQELILDSGDPVWWVTEFSSLPARNERTYYQWNGKYYIPGYREFAQPEFRFQAIQDGDLALSQQEYVRALDFYQQAIFSDKLKDYSPEIHNNLLASWGGRFTNDPTPTAVAPDITEYPRLAAYAYYRMVILHVHLHEMDAAQIQYATLQEKFPVGNPGHPYVEMAMAFWDAHQSTGKMYDACAAAIAYADAHGEILVPLGSDYHGTQSHIYTPADVCPFR